MRYVVRRLLLLVPTMLLVLTVVFVLVRVAPGDVVTLLASNQNISADQAARLRHDLGLDQSLPLQFVHYLRAVLTGDFGRSIWSGRSVASEFAERLPVTAELAALALVLSIVIGIPIGALSAARQDRWLDYILRGVAIAGLSIPGFWLGTLAIVLPTIWWNYSPPLRYVSLVDDPLANLRQFLVPAFIMSLALSSVLMRMTRSVMLEALRQDYVRTARAKGLASRTILMRHVLKNSMIPVLTILGTQFATLLGGTVIFESIFNIKGVGSYVFLAVSQRDYPVIQSVNIFLAAGVLLVNLGVDLTYGLLDPRLSRSR